MNRLSLFFVQMKKPCCPWVFCAVLAGTLLTACSRKTDAKAELEKAARVLAEGPSSSAPAPAPAPSSAAEQPAAAPDVAVTPAATPAQQMQQAIVAYRSGNLEDAVTRLQKLRMTVALTAQQRMAVQDGVAAVMTEVYGMAAAGDARAIEAVKQYEQMQTTR